MKKMTSGWVYQVCQDLYAENSEDFYDVDMFISDIEDAIENVLKDSYNNEPVFIDIDTYNEVITGLMSWLRSADGVDNWDDKAACILFRELEAWANRKLEAWANRKFRSEEN